MLTLHHLRIGRSIFTVWLLEEVGVQYDLKVYHRDPKTMRAPEELKQIHPLGKSPVIEDGDLVLSESGAITSYILQKFDTQNKFSPTHDDLPGWARYQQWLAYAEASVFAPLLIKLLLTRGGVDHPVLGPFSDAEFKLHFDHITRQLGESEFILGESISGADFGVTYMVSMAERLGLLGGYPNLQAYLQRNTSRDAFKRAIERAVE
ncbi:MAG: glutathione S-transferase family protein [Gammaproteobacteria bacterium]|nr:glutathione S-transferase family protein [Gammaproteobacteria bacterium]